MRVTDEMVEAYVEAVNAHLASLTPKQWEIERFDPKASINRVARIGLEAALSHAAGQEAWIDLADTPFGRGYTTSLDPLSMPAGRYVLTPAVARSEGEEGA